MPFFIVTLTHPDDAAWLRHAAAHVAYLRKLVDEGTLMASGPIKSRPIRAGFLILKGATRADIEAVVQADPFTAGGAIGSVVIEEWDPLFGAFADQSTGKLDGVGGIG